MTELSNRLINETSSYLRQHADNPVHWQPWDRVALDKAKELNRPILLSIGYSACHWCHVMAHESFEDKDVAKVMNDHFINIKVDREERPDIDQIYIAALSAMGQQGGWPLTMFLRPDGKPFWGGTYFPKMARHNMPGFIDVMNAVHNLWNDNQEKINHNAEAVFLHLEAQMAAQRQPSKNDPAIFNQIANRINTLIDPVLGGIEGAPKFPNAPFMDTLWFSWLTTQNSQHRDNFLHSLKTMLQGGIYDHLGGGLCRYSTDAQWFVPHFEKMLYDNAQLICHANWAYGFTNDDLFRLRIEETINWMISELRLANGSFASSLDADSEGIEGKFYVWSEQDIDKVLGPDAADFKNYYGVSQKGNWEGANILNRLHALDKAEVLNTTQRRAKQTLLNHRNQRVRPARDDKALTDWNAFAIRALAEAGRCLERAEWVNYARVAYETIAATFENGQLAHCQMSDRLLYPALSSDYAAMINAALALYEATSDQKYIQHAIRYKIALDENHRDAAGNYRLSALTSDDVILHSYGDQDEAIPSATSQIIEAFTRLYLASYDLDLFDQIQTLTEQAMGRAVVQKYGQIGIINAGRIFAEPLSLIILAESDHDELLSVARQNPDPRRLDKYVPLKGKQIVQLPAGGTIHADRASAFLCKGNVCLPPVHSAEELEQLLQFDK